MRTQTHAHTHMHPPHTPYPAYWHWHVVFPVASVQYQYACVIQHSLQHWPHSVEIDKNNNYNYGIQVVHFFWIHSLESNKRRLPVHLLASEGSHQLCFQQALAQHSYDQSNLHKWLGWHHPIVKKHWEHVLYKFLDNSVRPALHCIYYH